MKELTAFDVAFRGTLTGNLSEVFKTALDQGRVLTVSTESLAPLIAENADAINVEVISVVDAVNQPVGYIFPGWVTKQVTVNLAPVSNLVAAIRVLELEPKQVGRPHLHEWLNFDRPQTRKCAGNGNPHDTFFDPCLIPGHS